MSYTYKQSMSLTEPEVVDSTSSNSIVYIRRNIVHHDVIDEENPEYWEYEEAQLTREEYEKYLKEISIPKLMQMRADIDYLAIMNGIDLEG